MIRGFVMRFRNISVLAALIALAAFVPSAQGGAIRFAGKELHKGSTAAVQKTSDATGAAMGSVEDAGKAARTTLENGTSVVRTNVVSAPDAAVKGTKAAAGKIWKALW